MAEKPDAPRLVENLPSSEGSVSALASANAPIIYFDEVANFGTYNGVAHMTMLAHRFMIARTASRGGT